MKCKDLEYLKQNAYFIDIGELKIPDKYANLKKQLGDSFSYYIATERNSDKVIGSITVGNKNKSLFEICRKRAVDGIDFEMYKLKDSITEKDFKYTTYEIAK